MVRWVNFTSYRDPEDRRTFFAANCWTVDSSEYKTLDHYGHKFSRSAAMQTGSALFSMLKIKFLLVLLLQIKFSN